MLSINSNKRTENVLGFSSCISLLEYKFKFTFSHTKRSIATSNY